MKKQLIRAMLFAGIVSMSIAGTKGIKAEETTTAPVITTTEAPTTVTPTTETPTTVAPTTEVPTTKVEPAKNPKVKKGWKKTKAGYRYYYTKSGKYYKSVIKKIKKSKYLFNKKGYRQTGLQKFKKKYYYFKKNGKMVYSTTKNIKGVYYVFDKKGVGQKKNYAQSKADSLIKSITSSKDSSATKLQKGFVYMMYHYRYGVKAGYLVPSGSDWVSRFSYNIMTTKTGRCYSFAAAYCVYAKELGYNAKVIVGKTTAAGGGYVPHAWVEITHGTGTYVYDPELAYQTKNFSSYYRRTYYNTGARYRK